MVAHLTDLLSALAAVVSAAFVVAAFFYARREIHAWKEQERLRRCSQIGEDVFTSAHEAADLIRSLRYVGESIPIEKVKDRTFTYRRRHKLMVEHGGKFDALRSAQIRAKAVIQDKELDDIIAQIFGMRRDFMFALECAIDYLEDVQQLRPEVRQQLTDFKRTIFGLGNEKDEFHVLLVKTLDQLDEKLQPVIRFDAQTTQKDGKLVGLLPAS